jgi:hypothetical protein
MINFRKLVLLSMCFTMLFLFGCWSYVSKAAKQKFDTRDGAFSVTVYPVSIVVGSERLDDEYLAADVIDFLIKEELAVPVMASGVIDIPVKWGYNQAKMAQQSALNFSDQMKEEEIKTDYALMVEILCNSSETNVGGVHYYLCDKDGNLANGGLTNSHWDEFHEVEPQDRKGGLEVAKLMLRKGWIISENETIAD